MIHIRPLSHFDPPAFIAISGGYTTTEMYRMTHSESDALAAFTLTLERLPAPEEFRFPFPESDRERYDALVPNAFSLGAYDGDALAGVALSEPQQWNNVVWVWEFHVAPAYQRQGLGRRLMAVLAERARAAGFRALVAETQNTNVPAIRFYRSVGYAIEGVDISYYTNQDLQPGHNMAIFMKLRLE
jgi:ribosomal protein S18 acetylase RimI-like enzyme